jgi:hypothetical protein
VTRAYRVPGPVFGGGPEATEGLRSRVARGRPNWWVILAVSLGLMALLVATAGGTPPAPRRAGGDADAQAASRTSPRAGRTGAAPLIPTTTTTTAAGAGAGAGADAAVSPPSGATDLASSARTTGASGAADTPPAGAPSDTTTTLAPATTTTTTGAAPSSSVAADRTQTQGYLNPPLQPSNQFGFTGTGAMEISVVWSGNTYLTMTVSCPSGDQDVGGTSAMAASLPDASGSCLATVSEPTSETTSLTYTITIGPAGG